MRSLSRTILLLSPLLCLLFATMTRADVVVSLVTVGPGDAVWERFGHNMIRLQITPPDSTHPIDASYNWGLFDFNKPNFIFNFIQGRPVYTMAPVDTQLELDDYHQQNRHVSSQRLNLPDAQLRELLRRCAENFRENPDYRYDYFRDNCSTRVRDMLDGVTNGALSSTMKGRPTAPPVSYRHEAIRLMQDDFWVSFGMDFALGPAADKPLDLWAEGFLPETVARAAAVITGPRTELWPSMRPLEPNAPPKRSGWMLLAGLLGGGAIVALARWRPWAGTTGVCLWWLISGLGGAFMLYFWTVTDHVAAYANQNLWHYSPLALAGLVLLLLRRRVAMARLAWAIVAISGIGVAVWAFGRCLGGPIAQPNGGFILLALPLNLAAALVTAKVATPALTNAPTADEVAGL